MDARSCPRCGSAAPVGSRFCAACGAALDPIDGPDPTAPGAGSTPPATEAASVVAPPGGGAPSGRRRRRGCLVAAVLIVITVLIGGAGAFVASGGMEYLKPLEAATFDDLVTYAVGRSVSLDGGLALPDAITCHGDETRCPAQLVELVDQASTATPRRTWIFLDRSAIDDAVRGRLVAEGTVVRVTGRVCVTTSDPPEPCIRVDRLEAIAGPIAAVPTERAGAAPTPADTSGPQPTPTLSEAALLLGACFGRAVPDTAPYAGKTHPLVVANAAVSGSWNRIWENIAINERWTTGEWPLSRIQLVLCPRIRDAKRVDSCGTYTRTDGVAGEIVRYREVLTIRVVVATTGQTLQAKTLLGEVEPCLSKYTSLDAISLLLDDEPPWHVDGPAVTEDQIDEYATSVSRQAIK